MSPNELLSLAAKAAVEGGKAIMEVYAQDDLGVDYKADQSPLTLADKKCNTVINGFLTNTPIALISEENKQIDFETRAGWEACWIVDPLDGTKEFIKRNGEFTVNIALVVKGQPKLGVIYVPVTGELYLGDVESEKAYKIPVDNHQLEALELSDKYLIEPSAKDPSRVRVVGSRSHMNKETEDFVEAQKASFEEVEIVSKGSSLKFCLVAEGKADLYPRYAPTMEWDTAAGQAICEAVGLEVIAQDTQAPMRYNKENLLNPWFLVQKSK